MSYFKISKDYIAKALLGTSFLPRGVFELSEYFRIYKSITFDYHKEDDGTVVAVSTNFQYGSIITSAHSIRELDKNIKDAILTAFSIPSVYSSHIKIHKVGEQAREYALT